MRTAIVDDGNPGTRHGTSATAPATTVACANDAEVLDRLLKVLNSHKFTFEQLMGSVDALGYQPHIGLLSIVPPDTVQRLQATVQLANATLGGNFPVTSEAAPSSVPSSSGTGVAGVPQMDTDGPPSAEKARDQNSTGAAEMKTENVETQPSPSPPDSNSNILFAAMMNLDVHLTVLHAALPLHMALLLFSGHSDLHSMSTLAAHQVEYQGRLN
ncbi:hypothetical protein BJY52DRAFT_1200720 [Lactarius psammicola]|nr:hypothetical protein BJY52DRAFT_1200720 [Lactarius psammicola]